MCPILNFNQKQERERATRIKISIKNKFWPSPTSHVILYLTYSLKILETWKMGSTERTHTLTVAETLKNNPIGNRIFFNLNVLFGVFLCIGMRYNHDEYINMTVWHREILI